MLSASAGALIKQIDGSYSFFSAGPPYKSLGMNSVGDIVISGKQIASFSTSSTSFSWSKYNTTVATMGIVFGNPDNSYVANFAKSLSYSYLTLLQLVDGSIFYQSNFPFAASYGFLAEKVITGS